MSRRHRGGSHVCSPGRDRSGRRRQKAAVENLEKNVIPRLRDAGARAAYWLDAPDGQRRVSVMIFDTEEAAKAQAAGLAVGQTPAGAPDGVKILNVQVNEVMLSL